MYEMEKKELVEEYGFVEAIAKDLLVSRNAKEIEIVIDFLRRYGHMIKVNDNLLDKQINKEEYVVFNNEMELFQHETLEEALKEYEAEKDKIEDFYGDERVYLAKVIQVAYTVKDIEREAIENPNDSGYEGWVKWVDEKI